MIAGKNQLSYGLKKHKLRLTRTQCNYIRQFVKNDNGTGSNKGVLLFIDFDVSIIVVVAKPSCLRNEKDVGSSHSFKSLKDAVLDALYFVPN